jgi:uncharacterized protein YabN with tetrapyrrole methylase and pyrophosphatase domain
MMSENLDRLIKIEEDACSLGFEWPDVTSILEQIVSECDEVKDALQNNESKERIQEEIGDLLHASISLCLFAGFNPEDTLSKVACKIENRMDLIKIAAKQRGLDSLKGQTTEFMLELWDEAKKASK